LQTNRPIGNANLLERGESQNLRLKTRVEAADALARVGDPRLEENNWLVIPACTFWMGAQKNKPNAHSFDPEVFGDESPVHEVSLSLFRVHRFSMTVQAYGLFLIDKE
jgi:formylglycine-generating enzyme required for sulfatase activity